MFFFFNLLNITARCAPTSQSYTVIYERQEVSVSFSNFHLNPPRPLLLPVTQIILIIINIHFLYKIMIKHQNFGA